MKKALGIFLFILFFSPVFALQAQGEMPAPIKILVVPGHDNKSFGSQYGNTKEADMNLALATRIFDLLKKDKRYEVYITRDKGGYTKEFTDFFDTRFSSIETFIESSKQNIASGFAALVARGFVEKANTPHGATSNSMVTKLYGFNKWANENEMDAVIHIHFNDYKRKNKWAIGDRRGFAIYIPDEQFVNSEDSYELADDIFDELKKKYKTSNYINELGGMVFDQKLIAIGANRTLVSSVRVALIEYGYIYEFRDTTARRKAYDDMAGLTVDGMERYFFDTGVVLSATQ